MESRVCLYGASGHGKVIIDIIKSNGLAVAIIIDDNPKIKEMLDITVVQYSETLDLKNKSMIVSIGNNMTRKKIVRKLQTKFYTAIHKTAVVSFYSEINEGTVIMAGSIINPAVRIGKHCIINTGAIVEHDCIIEDFVHISPNASLAGDVTVGEGAHIGIGASVIQGIKIGRWSTIGAGAIIINDVPDYAVVVGNPGKVIKYMNQEN